MVEFGEEMIIDSFRIPWLIWIQVIVFLLLLLLLYSFSLLTSFTSPDLSPDDPLYCSAPPSSSSSKKLQQQVGEITAASSRSSIRGNKAGNHRQEGCTRTTGTNDNEKKEVGSSALIKERSISSQSLYNNNHHPCNIVRLAKIAFLKCLGLDSTPTSTVPGCSSSFSREHMNER